MDGRPLLEHAVRAGGVLDPRVVVLGARAEEIRAIVDLHGAEPVVCDGLGRGQSASLRRRPAAAVGDVDAVVVVLGDMPGITAAAVDAVVAGRGRRRRAGRYAGEPGHPVLLGRPLLARAAELHGDVGFRRLLEAARCSVEIGHLADPATSIRERGAGTAMKLEQSFEVQAPIDEVWKALIDLERVAPCLPGAAITQRDEDGTYHGTFKVKLGPATAAYNGTIKIEEADESAHRATLKARGTDKRGQGGASATIVNTLSEAGDATRVEAVTDFSITGRLAAFGRGGMIQDISNRLMRDFATCLQGRLAAEPAGAGTPEEEAAGAGAAAAAEPEVAPDGPPDAPGPAPGTPDPGGSTPPPPSRAAAAPSPPPAAKPINGVSLFFSVLAERIRNLFKRSS